MSPTIDAKIVLEDSINQTRKETRNVFRVRQIQQPNSKVLKVKITAQILALSMDRRKCAKQILIVFSAKRLKTTLANASLSTGWTIWNNVFTCATITVSTEALVRPTTKTIDLAVIVRQASMVNVAKERANLSGRGACARRRRETKPKERGGEDCVSRKGCVPGRSSRADRGLRER